jgi:peptidoglycan glycosyltransferase
MASHDFGAVAKRAQQLAKDPTQPLLNRAIQMRLPPGSTFKVVTASAAIESGNYTADSMVPGGPTYQLPLTPGATGQIDNEGRDCGTNRIPFKQAMGNSCNTSFAALANEVGAEKLQETAEGFGFNQHYLDDLGPQAESNFPTDMDAAQTGQAGIGQFEVAATPLQMAMVAAGIANNGTVMRPYLIAEEDSPDLDVLSKTDPEPIEDQPAVSPSVARQVTQMMVDVVDNGTGTPARIPGVQVAGKTGTAQSAADRPPYAWFLSFAPADDPKVAVAVLIQDAGVARDAISGGGLAAPIAKAVMEAVINK